MAEDTASDTAPRGLDVHYLRGNSHRTILAVGAWGGPSPSGVVFTMYSERAAIPRQTRIEAKDGQRSESVIETRGGLVRELEVTINMPIESVIVFHNWLAEQIEAALKIRESGERT